ncbi:MAG: hypothetical protein WD154_07940 [Nitrosopumilaceae archaeon]
MSIKEVSAKLTSDELDKFLEICKDRDCTPSDLIKKLVLSLIETSGKKQATKVSPQSQAKLQAEEPQAQSLDESLAIEIIKKIENDEVNEQDLHELYVKLGEKLEKTGLEKFEEALFRKVHKRLRDKLLQHVATKKAVNVEEKPINVEERFRYF